jgi:choline dehydrogenase-like flavoprotein
MMNHAEHYGGTHLAADVIIVGAGPAGITIAREFVQNPRTRICLIESGFEGHSDTAQSLALGENAGLPYFPLDRCRFRRFGGSMNGWPADHKHAPTSIAPMDPLDFEARPWAGLAGWPFGRAEMEPFYARAQALFRTGPWDYEPRNWQTATRPFQPFDPDRLTHRIWQYAPGMNFGRRYRDELDATGNITILTGQTVTEILTDADGRRATGVRIADQEGRWGKVRAGIVVLACGAIENARLLLLSTAAMPAGLGNGHDLVGRYFMEHPHLSCAQVHFTSPRNWLAAYKTLHVRNTGIRAGICLSEAAQRRHETLSFSGILVDQFVIDPETGGQSPGYVALKSLLMRTAIHHRSPRDAIHQLGAVAADWRSVLKGARRHVQGLNGAIYARSEQAPNPDSRVTLATECDLHGLPRARLEWRLSPIDKHTIRIAIETARQEFARLGLGTVTPESWLIEDDHSWPPWLKGGYHHMGTTRMATSPQTGVVDPDCQVFGTANLYVAGSSVFPAAGYANPTLTLIALALRLADHLKAQLHRMETTAFTIPGAAAADPVVMGMKSNAVSKEMRA